MTKHTYDATGSCYCDVCDPLYVAQPSTSAERNCFWCHGTGRRPCDEARGYVPCESCGGAGIADPTNAEKVEAAQQRIIDREQSERAEWDRVAEACGFATVAQQERLGRIFDALRAELDAYNGHPCELRHSYAERVVLTDPSTVLDNAPQYTAQQDAHCVWFNDLATSAAIQFKYDGAVTHFGGTPNPTVVTIFSRAIARLA
jgi:hypothetical protein